MNEENKPNKLYDVHILDGKWRDDMVPGVCFRRVSLLEVNDLLIMAKRQGDVEVAISLVKREGRN